MCSPAECGNGHRIGTGRQPLKRQFLPVAVGMNVVHQNTLSIIDIDIVHSETGAHHYRPLSRIGREEGARRKERRPCRYRFARGCGIETNLFAPLCLSLFAFGLHSEAIVACPGEVADTAKGTVRNLDACPLLGGHVDGPILHNDTGVVGKVVPRNHGADAVDQLHLHISHVDARSFRRYREESKRHHGASARRTRPVGVAS